MSEKRPCLWRAVSYTVKLLFAHYYPANPDSHSDSIKHKKGRALDYLGIILFYSLIVRLAWYNFLASALTDSIQMEANRHEVRKNKNLPTGEKKKKKNSKEIAPEK
ncbi:hypothetical protein EV426DRAFT_626457, partial [Tirmania nivea]